METCAECGKPIAMTQPSYYRVDPNGGIGKPFHSECGDPLGINTSIATAVARERERCAKVMVTIMNIGTRSNDYLQGFEDGVKAYIDAIRKLN